MLADEGSGHNRVWVSPDGATWTALPTGTFGRGSAVVSVAASRDSVVALTLELGADFCDGPPDLLGCHDLTGPLQAWTSTDGTSWTAHPVATVPLPGEMNGQDDEHPILEPGVAPLLLLRSDGRWRAVSDDGADLGPPREQRLTARLAP